MFISLARGILGFIAAALAAGVVQVLFVTGLDIVRPGPAPIESMGLLVLLAATQSAVFAAPFALLAVIVATLLPTRGSLYFMGAGLAIALGGFFAQHAGESGPNTVLNRYALSAYAVSGLLAGLVYWLVSVPKRREKAPSRPASA